MTTYQLATTAFYASLALFALIATWRGGGKRQVGVVLFGCWVASNVVFWTLDRVWWPVALPILDVLFALTAASASKITGSRVPWILIALSVMAIAANWALSAIATVFGISVVGSNDRLNTYLIILNIIFAAQCLVTGTWGMGDAKRIGRFNFGAPPRGGRPEPAHHPWEDTG